jgi:dsRNA-specific ribonuclease
MGEIQKMIDHLEPGDAAAEIAEALKKLFPLLDEEDRTQFVMNLVGESSGDKIASMVHL